MRLPDFRRSRAVLIGAARYDSDDLPDLPAVERNVAALEERLRDPVLSGFSGKNCVTVLNPERSDDVIDPVQVAAGLAEDVLFVYYAGHGLLDRNGELHLGLRHSELQRRWNSLRFEDFAEALLDSDAKSTIVVLDCCYSGLASRYLQMGDEEAPAAVADQAPEEVVEQAAKKMIEQAAERQDIDGLYVLMSSSATKASLAPEGDEFTAFTGRLLKLIDTGVPGPHELLTMQTLYAAVRDEMQRRRLPRPQQHSGNLAGEAALFRNRVHFPAVPLIENVPAGRDRRMSPVWRRAAGGALCLTVLAGAASASADTSVLAACAAPESVRMLVPLDTVEMFTDVAGSYEYATRGAGYCQRVRVTVAGASRDDAARAFALSWRTPKEASTADRRLLRRIGLPPDVWIADLGVDMAAVQAVLATAPGAAVTVPGDPVQWSLAESPVVLAEPGAPASTPRARPASAWGELVSGVVRPDPDTTTVGRLVNVSLYPAGQQAGVARDRVQRPLDAAAVAAGQGIGPPDVTGLLCRSRDTRLIVAEWQLVRHNLHRDNGECPGVWDARYPGDTGWLDYPMVRPVWAGRPARRSAGDLTAWLRSAAGARVLADNGLRPRSAGPDSGIISTNGALANWSARPAYATSAASLERAESAYEAARKPATVLVAVDGSGSMTARSGGRSRFDAALDGIAASIGAMGPRDRVGLFLFSTAIKGGIAEIPGDDRKAIDRARAYRPAGGTPLHQAIDHGVRELRTDSGTAAGDRHRILVVLTDGEDTTRHPLPRLDDDSVRVVIANVGVSACPEPALAALTREHGDCIGVPSGLVDVRVAEQIGRLWQR
ncbi:hypothetical protein Aca07nite_66530 [Actinoplanes capillaceus]|uniref:VWFA domain-containing protein n=1 Tax=Actinoplanes campanulatus TaxID=113559 RepID=A0ABQ3WSV8_9ACTN|nr:caspase family protein [Actinoplanes capillaceus]GID49378.1 hypothetical protein Aca07nite_66530 [Actinoplanes capillaceus]